MARRALILANSRYRDENFGDLPAAAADATALTEVLGDPEIGGFDVTRLTDVDVRPAMRALESFFTEAGRDDLLLLHLSVHGWKDLHNDLYFVMRDTERDYPDSSAISAEVLRRWMTRSRSRHIVLMLDCCYSGAFSLNSLRRSGTPSVDVAEPLGGIGRVVITASTSLQFAHESDRDVRFSRSAAQPSVFTTAIVAGLRDGAADLDGDGRISVHELYEFAHERLRQRAAAQTPTLSVDSAQGAIYIARCPRGEDADELAQLRAAVNETKAWKRVGSLHLLEVLLGSVHETTRAEASAALAALAADPDPQVARRARELWHERGLGDLPEPRREPPGGFTGDHFADAPPRPESAAPRRDSATPTGVGADHPDAAAPPKPRTKLSGDTRYAVGIDFGTTNSAVAYFDGTDVRLIPNAEGFTTTPSLVAVTEDGSTLVGAAAKRQALTNPGGTIRSVKLDLGRSWTLNRAGTALTPESAAALILGKLRVDAEAHLGQPLAGAVLTVPANFTQAQRDVLRQAGETAGMRVLRIVSEPSAAAFTLGPGSESDKTVLVFDLGGGTLDVSVVEVGDGVIEVKATAGDGALGGDNWDHWVLRELLTRIRHRHGADVTVDRTATQRLRDAAEAAKIELSAATSARVNVPYLSTGPYGVIHVDETLTRAELEAGTGDLLRRCQTVIRQAITDSGVDAADVDQVVLTGGATRMPAIARMVRQTIGETQVYRGLIPEGVVNGAALQAGVLMGTVKDALLLDAISASVSLVVKESRLARIIERNTTIPTKRSEVFATTVDGQSTMMLQFLQGDRVLAADNKPLAVLELTGLSPVPAGTPKVMVTIDLDANADLHIGARELAGDPEELRDKTTAFIKAQTVDPGKPVAPVEFRFTGNGAQTRVNRNTSTEAHAVFGANGCRVPDRYAPAVFAPASQKPQRI